MKYCKKFLMWIIFHSQVANTKRERCVWKTAVKKRKAHTNGKTLSKKNSISVKSRKLMRTFYLLPFFFDFFFRFPNESEKVAKFIFVMETFLHSAQIFITLEQQIINHFFSLFFFSFFSLS